MHCKTVLEAVVTDDPFLWETFPTSSFSRGKTMKKLSFQLLAVAVACLIATAAYAKIQRTTVSGVMIPGVDEMRMADPGNSGMATAKVRANPRWNTFVARLRGTAPNQSGKHARVNGPFGFMVNEEVSVTGFARLRYSRPRNEQSRVSGLSRGIVVENMAPAGAN